MSGDFVTVTVKQGALKGRLHRTSDGLEYASFEGVPYAKPPYGNLRFKSPEPADSWTGLRDATSPGNQCLHYDSISKRLVGDEDCLFINVYTPGLPSIRHTVSRPVMVYIHGGGFASGTGHMYGSEPLLSQGVLVVNFNYRLGPLGFLSLQTLEVPGNAGLKDQVLALHWVKENISAFGGDPDNVTIFGDSAGGASVHFLMISPLTRGAGLFQRGIAQSGSALCPWALVKEPRPRARTLALAAGCDAETVNDAVALARWLRVIPAGAIVVGVETVVAAEESPATQVLPFVPCVEPLHPGAFLPQLPKDLLASGLVPPLPIIFGLTSDEGILFLPVGLLKFSKFRTYDCRERTPAEAAAVEREVMALTLSEIASHPERLLPDDLPGRNDPREAPLLQQRVKNFFFEGRNPSEEAVMGLVDLFSDLYFVLGVVRAACQHARLGAPVHMYEFAFSGSINYLTLLLQPRVEGVSHGDEVSYLFNIPEIPRPEEGSPEAKVRQCMLRMWTDYAKYGNPTPTFDDIITVNWLPFLDNSPHFLRIDNDLQARMGIFGERMLFWSDLYTK